MSKTLALLCLLPAIVVGQTPSLGPSSPTSTYKDVYTYTIPFAASLTSSEKTATQTVLTNYLKGQDATTTATYSWSGNTLTMTISENSASLSGTYFDTAIKSSTSQLNTDISTASGTSVNTSGVTRTFSSGALNAWATTTSNAIGTSIIIVIVIVVIGFVATIGGCILMCFCCGFACFAAGKANQGATNTVVITQPHQVAPAGNQKDVQEV